MSGDAGAPTNRATSRFPASVQLSIVLSAMAAALVIVESAGSTLVVTCIVTVVAACAAAFGVLRIAGNIERSFDALATRIRDLAPDDDDRIGRATLLLAERLGAARQAEAGFDEATQHLRRARGLLFAAVSHDLKSPLNAVLGFSDLLAASELTDDQRESVAVIASRGRELVALVETVLDSARVAAGQLKLTMAASDLATVLDDACRQAEELALVSAAFDVPRFEPMPLGSVSAPHLTRAFAIVLAHALKTRPVHAGSGRADAIRLRAYFLGKRYRIDIDYDRGGPGASLLGALLEGRSRTRARGSELGLRLARSVVELHRGRVEVSEGEGGRPRISIFVPRDQPNSEP